MQTTQLKISVSTQLKTLTEARALDFGIPVSQYIKFLILDDLKSSQSKYKMTERTEEKARNAISDIKNATETSNIKQFLDELE